MRLPYERIGPPPVYWGETLCGRRRCVELAVLTIDGWPFCLDCGDDEIERAVAVELLGAERLREAWPSLEDR